MMKIRRSNERGMASEGWLKSRYSFSFANYRDDEWVKFGKLRVINEDWIAAGSGFPMHSHRDMEIVTIMLSGELHHRDSMGNEQVLRAGEVQSMSAGTGNSHSEWNASETGEAHLYQIWKIPVP
ncbi:MAG: pirin family protein, partial [Lentisphaeraceae bacterium]|nr:pirin family protein [Lentisphaeraceae bacterium]